MRILGRVLSSDDHGATVEANPAFLEECTAALDLVGANGVATPTVKSEHFEACTSAEILERKRRGRNRSDR